MRLSQKKSLSSAGPEQSAGMAARRGRGDGRWHISVEMKEEVRRWVSRRKDQGKGHMRRSQLSGSNLHFLGSNFRVG